MATTDQVWAALEAQISTAMLGTNPLLYNAAVFPQPEIAIDWPPLPALQAVATGALPTIISIFDRGAEKAVTNAIPLWYALPPTLGTSGATLTISTTSLNETQSLTITGSGVPLVNDAFCLTLAAGSNQQFQFFANYTALSTDTLHTALVGLTAQINLLSGITAVLAGVVITITNTNPTDYVAWSEVVNVGSFTQEGFRWNRDIQITVWSRTPSDRSKYGNILEQLFSQLEVNYGFFAADSSACRVVYKDDVVHKDTQLQDMYRRDFLVSVDYPVLNVIPGYVIETIPQTFSSD